MKNVASCIVEDDLDAGLVNMGVMILTVYEKVLSEECRGKRNDAIDKILVDRPDFLLRSNVKVDRQNKKVHAYYDINEETCRELQSVLLPPAFVCLKIQYCVNWLFDMVFPDDYRLTVIEGKIYEPKESSKKPIPPLKPHKIDFDALYEAYKNCDNMPSERKPSKYKDPLKSPLLNSLISFDITAVSVNMAKKRDVAKALKVLIGDLIKEEGKPNLNYEGILKQAIISGYVTKDGIPQVKPGTLIKSIRSIIKNDRRYCEYCGKEMEGPSNRSKRFHSSCRSERSKRSKYIGKEVRIEEDYNMYKVIDVKRGKFIVEGKDSKEIEVMYKTSRTYKREDKIPVIAHLYK